jgi:hypothetical protein
MKYRRAKIIKVPEGKERVYSELIGARLWVRPAIEAIRKGKKIQVYVTHLPWEAVLGAGSKTSIVIEAECVELEDEYCDEPTEEGLFECPIS